MPAAPRLGPAQQRGQIQPGLGSLAWEKARESKQPSLSPPPLQPPFWSWREAQFQGAGELQGSGKPRLYLPFYGMSSRGVERGPGEGARRHPAVRAHRARSPCPCGSPRKRGVPWVLLNPGTPDCKVSPGIPACPLTHLMPVCISLVFTVPVSCEGF